MNTTKQIIRKYTSISLVLRIFIGLAIGAVLGLLVLSWTGIGILGRMFVSALKSIAPVLVTSSVAKAGKGHGSRFALCSTDSLVSFKHAHRRLIYPSTCPCASVWDWTKISIRSVFRLVQPSTWTERLSPLPFLHSLWLTR